MNTVKEIFDKLCEFAPLELQESFDNSGFLVGHAAAPVHTALLSLDVTNEVIEEAKSLGAELIISHHPAIWEDMKSVTDETVEKARVLRLIENGIAVISMHTNLDIAEGGVNDVLLSLLGADNRGPFEEEHCGRMGELAESVSLTTFLASCKDKLRTNGLRFYDAGRPVRKIAVMGGSGGANLIDAYKCGCDTYLTADVKYSIFLLARELGINLSDGDHFCTENPVIASLAERLSEAFPDTRFVISSRHTQTACFY